MPSMAAVSSSLMFISAWATRERRYANEAMYFARSGSIWSSFCTILRTDSVSADCSFSSFFPARPRNLSMDMSPSGVSIPNTDVIDKPAAYLI
jgi:hypothetical protein